MTADGFRQDRRGFVPLTQWDEAQV